MNLEKQLLEKFQIEELEKRYEFSWIPPIVAGGGPGEGTGTVITGPGTGTIAPIGEPNGGLRQPPVLSPKL